MRVDARVHSKLHSRVRSYCRVHFYLKVQSGVQVSRLTRLALLNLFVSSINDMFNDHKKVTVIPAGMYKVWAEFKWLASLEQWGVVSEQWGVVSEQWAVGSGRHQWKTLVLLCFSQWLPHCSGLQQW